MKELYKVLPITREEAKDYILNIHYAKRFPSVSYYFGLFRGKELVGCVTYGTPPSSALRVGVAGKENKEKVIELNRLVLKDNIKNEASFLIGRSLRLLKGGLIVVSFADTSQNHIGKVYQAANFKYFGLSAKRTDWKVKGKEHLHGQTIADEFRGKPNRSKLMREKYGDAFYLSPRPRKHRYIFITGKNKDYSIIKYKQEDYPRSWFE